MQLSHFFAVSHKLVLTLVVSLCCNYAISAGSIDNSPPQDLQGHWRQAPAEWQFSALDDLKNPQLNKISTPSLTGGSYVFEAPFTIKDGDPFVVDFKNASVLAAFNHRILDAAGVLVAEAQGGISANVENPFMLRHARVFNLPPGSYTLVTTLSSPYFIAQPQPYVDSLAHYQTSIKWGDFLALVSLGVLFSLGVYYAIMAAVHKQVTEITYAIFIFCNLIFNSMTMLVLPDLFGVHWFYLAGAPILISNIAYVIFVMSLLEIKLETHLKLYRVGQIIIGLLLLLLLLALVLHHWVIEFARYGVGLMLAYGMVAGVLRAREGFTIAKMYLFAIFAFGMIGSFAISANDLKGVYTIYIEHVGLLAVTVEVLLIGLVLGYQFAQLHRENEHNLTLLEHSLKVAHTDALTGLPNRYALDKALLGLSPQGMLTFIDMDNLKHYNDNYGHGKGDLMLQVFAEQMTKALDMYGVLHRIGGDEFAITSYHADSYHIGRYIDEAIEEVRKQGFTLAGASYGSVKRHELANVSELKEVADARMYQAKRSKKTENTQQRVLEV